MHLCQPTVLATLSSMNSSRCHIIAISGGIGSGKSMVRRILSAMGYSVYDCDSKAKWLMDTSDEIKGELRRTIHSEAVKNGEIDRRLISEIVFADKAKLQALNSIVHGAVREDILRWLAAKPQDSVIFIETAILYQSGLDKMVHQVWEVTAPEDVRIERVMKRNGISAEEVKARMRSQEFSPTDLHPHVSELVNDGNYSLLLQINSLLADFHHHS